jgi:hydrogenase maturation protease
MTVVLGLGNPVLGDDAVGIEVAAELERLLAEEPIPLVRVATGTRGGFELIDILAGCERAVIVDCLSVARPVPGRVRRLGLGDAVSSARLAGSHVVSPGTAFQLAGMLGIAMPAAVDIYGIEGKDTTSFSEQLSPPVAEAVAPLARHLHERLKQRAGTHPDAPANGAGETREASRPPCNDLSEEKGSAAWEPHSP